MDLPIGRRPGDSRSGAVDVKREVGLSGIGLHTGLPVRVTLTAERGPVRLRAHGVESGIAELEVASTWRSTKVRAEGGRLQVETVEHALAAFAGLGIHHGCALAIDGPEMPLLDGGATIWCEALQALDLLRGHPQMRVAREALIEVGTSRYELSPADGQVDIEVHLELSDARIARVARWAGDPDDFQARIAPARTFALAHDIEELAASGRARHVDPLSVVVIAADAIHCAGRPFSPDEPARHKLLDLLGDMYLFGGPPFGRLRAVQPGHTANIRAMGRARSEGVLVPAHT